MLINRQEIVEYVTQGEETAATGFYPVISDGMNENVRASDLYGKWYQGTATPAAENANLTQDQVDACKILIDLGYAYTGTVEGGDVVFTDFPSIDFAFNNSAANKLIIEYVQETWNRFGIPATINTEAWSTLQQKLKAGDAEAARMGWLADFNDCINFLEIFISNSGNNYPRLGKELGDYQKASDVTKDAGMGAYWGPEGNQTWAECFDALVDQIKVAPDPQTRAELCAKGEQILMDTGCVAPIYFYTRPYMQKPEVKDVMVLPIGGIIFTYASIG